MADIMTVEEHLGTIDGKTVHVDAVKSGPTVYSMIEEDFFVNGSLTSRSTEPELMAAIWTAGRESMLVADKVDRTTKDAITALLSRINDCPYCEDMLISLVHAGGEHQAAAEIFAGSDFNAADDVLRRRLEWVGALAGSCSDEIPQARPSGGRPGGGGDSLRGPGAGGPARAGGAPRGGAEGAGGGRGAGVV